MFVRNHEVLIWRDGEIFRVNGVRWMLFKKAVLLRRRDVNGLAFPYVVYKKLSLRKDFRKESYEKNFDTLFLFVGSCFVCRLRPGRAAQAGQPRMEDSPLWLDCLCPSRAF